MDLSDEIIDDESGEGVKEAHDKDKEYGRENSESSDDERFVLPYNEELSSPGILKESVEKECGDSDSSDSEVTVPLKKRRVPVGDESDDDEFQILYESKAGGNDGGDSELLEDEASDSVDGGGGREEYFSDINYYAEKTVIKLRKRWF